MSARSGPPAPLPAGTLPTSSPHPVEIPLRRLAERLFGLGGKGQDACHAGGEVSRSRCGQGPGIRAFLRQRDGDRQKPGRRATADRSRPHPSECSRAASCPSSNTCAFVPDHPKPLTPARGGPPERRGHSMRSPATRRGIRSQSISGLGSWKCRCFGIVPRPIDRTALITPATPAAASKWPDVCFHRPDQDRAVRFAIPAVSRRRRARLDGVPDFRSRPVRLNVVHIRGLEPGPQKRVLNATFLRVLARHCQARGRAVLIHRGTADHSPDPVAVRLGLAQPLQSHDTAPFPSHVSVCNLRRRWRTARPGESIPAFARISKSWADRIA